MAIQSLHVRAPSDKLLCDKLLCVRILGKSAERDWQVVLKCQTQTFSTEEKLIAIR